MTRRVVRAWVLIGVCLFLAAAPLLAQEEADKEFGDRVRFLDDDGNPQAVEGVKVVSATFEKVEYQLRGGSSTKHEKDGRSVINIIYGDAPRVYLDGLQALQRKQFKQAASDFDGAKNAVEGGFVRDWLLEYASLNKGKALLALNHNDPSGLEDAITEFKAALQANPKSLLYDQIQLGLAEAYALQKKWADAKAAAADLQKVGEAIRRPIWQTLALRAQAENLIAQERYAEAVNAYEAMVALASREQRFAKGETTQKQLKNLEVEGAVEQGWAKVAWAESSGNQATWDQARSTFTALRSKYSDSELVKAASLNGVGRCLLEKDPRAALLLFTEAEVTHFTARREVARALYLKAEALEKLGRKKKADLARKELKEFFPDSPWAAK